MLNLHVQTKQVIIFDFVNTIYLLCNKLAIRKNINILYSHDQRFLHGKNYSHVFSHIIRCNSYVLRIFPYFAQVVLIVGYATIIAIKITPERRAQAQLRGMYQDPRGNGGSRGDRPPVDKRRPTRRDSDAHGQKDKVGF